MATLSDKLLAAISRVAFVWYHKSLRVGPHSASLTLVGFRSVESSDGERKYKVRRATLGGLKMSEQRRERSLFKSGSVLFPFLCSSPG